MIKPCLEFSDSVLIWNEPSQIKRKQGYTGINGPRFHCFNVGMGNFHGAENAKQLDDFECPSDRNCMQSSVLYETNVIEISEKDEPIGYY